MPSALDEAVQKAVDEAPPIETKEEKTVETKKEETPTLDAETQKAVDFFNAIQDPERGPALLKFMAEQAGVISEQTGVSKQQVAKAFVDELKDGVDPSLHFVIDSLAPNLEKLIKKQVGSETEIIKRTLQDTTYKQVERETNSEIDTFYKENKVSDDIKKKMDELAEEIPFDPKKSTIPKYMGRLLTLIQADSSKGDTVRRVVTQMTRNAKEVNLPPSETEEIRVKKGSGLPTLDEAVKSAFRGERLEA